MANGKSAELAEPSIGAFDDPSTLVTPEFSAVFMLPVLAVRDDQVDASLLEPFAQRIGVVGMVSDHHFRRPSPSSAPSNARHASSHTSCSCHCFNLRQQVAGEGYLSGKNRHAAPVRNTHRMPSRQARFDAHGRPRLSLRRFGSGSNGAINSHCASVSNSNRFSLMQAVHQITRLTQKSPA